MNPHIQLFKQQFSLFKGLTAYENDLVYTGVSESHSERLLKEAEQIIESEELPLEAEYSLLFRTLRVWEPNTKPMIK